MLEIILINSIFVLFPLLCYLIYAICMQNYSLKKKEFYLDFALISSCYLLIKYGYSYSTMVPKLMFHIPLIFAYLLNRKLGILILSLVGIYYYSSYNFGLYIILIEYVNSKLDRLGFGTLTRSVNFQKKFHLKQNKRIKNWKNPDFLRILLAGDRDIWPNFLGELPPKRRA